MSRSRKRGGRPSPSAVAPEPVFTAPEPTFTSFSNGQLWEVVLPLAFVQRVRRHPLALAAWVVLFTRMREHAAEGDFIDWPSEDQSIQTVLCHDLGVSVDLASQLINELCALGLAERREDGLYLSHAALRSQSLTESSERLQARIAAYQQRSADADQLGFDLDA